MMKFTISSFVMAFSSWLFSVFFPPPLWWTHPTASYTSYDTRFFFFPHLNFVHLSPRIDSLMIGHLLLSIIISTMCFFLSFSFFIQKKWLNFLVNERGKWTAERYYYYYYSVWCVIETTGRCIRKAAASLFFYSSLFPSPSYNNNIPWKENHLIRLSACGPAPLFFLLPSFIWPFEPVISRVHIFAVVVSLVVPCISISPPPLSPPHYVYIHGWW